MLRSSKAKVPFFAGSGFQHQRWGGGGRQEESSQNKPHQSTWRGSLRSSLEVPHHFFTPSFLCLNEREKQPSPASSEHLKEQLKCIIITHTYTRAAGLPVPSPPSSAWLCCVWTGVDYRRVIPFLLLCVLQCFDVGGKCQQRPRSRRTA